MQPAQYQMMKYNACLLKYQIQWKECYRVLKICITKYIKLLIQVV
jgi:hypothetical protein